MMSFNRHFRYWQNWGLKLAISDNNNHHFGYHNQLPVRLITITVTSATSGKAQLQ
jgi:hypothetical protein